MSEREVLLSLYRMYGKDEAISLLKKVISERDIEIGILKSEVAELKHSLSKKKIHKNEDGSKTKQQWSETEIGKIWQFKLAAKGEELSRMRKSKTEWQTKYFQLEMKIKKNESH